MDGLIDSKTDFLITIKNRISQYGFHEVENGYEKIVERQLPGQIMSINGRRMEQPGKKISVKYRVLFCGDGWIADINEETEREFTQIKFEIIQDENEVIGRFEECFYWNEPDYFINIFNQIMQ